MVVSDAFTLLNLGLQAWLLALAGIVAIRLLNGRISLAGVLTNGPQRTDPERVLLLVVTLFGAAWYVLTALEQWPTAAEVADKTRTFSLPDIPEQLLILLGGSQSSYIAAKIFRK